MKKYLPIIKYASVVALFLFSFLSHTHAQSSCTVQSMSFSEVPEKFSGITTQLKIKTSGCQEGISLGAFGIQGGENGVASFNRIYINKNPLKIKPASDGLVEVELGLSTSGCYKKNRGDGVLLKDWGFECVNYIVIRDANGIEVKTSNNPPLEHQFTYSKRNSEGREELRDLGVLLGTCNILGCDFGSTGPDDPDEDNWSFESIITGSAEGVGGTSSCSLSAGDGPDDASDVFFDTVETAGNSFVGKTGKLHIKTLENGCAGQIITIRLRTIVHSLVTFYTYTYDTSINLRGASGEDYLTVQAPLTTDLYVDFRIDDNGCEQAPMQLDCLVYVKINDTQTNIISTKEWLGKTFVGLPIIPKYSFESDTFKNKIQFKKGVLAYECNDSVVCTPVLGDNYWQVEQTNGVILNKDGELPDPLVIEQLAQIYDDESPCYVPFGTDLGNGKLAGPENGYYKVDCYELLAPIPGIGVTDQATGRSAIDKISEYELGEYINVLFQVAMGILMLLAVIMIIVAGVEYMTVESFFGKSRAKQRITGALTGLILGLGIFVILRTINPELLEVNFGKDVDTVVLGPQDPDTLPGQTSAVTRTGDQLTTTRYELPEHLKQSTGIYCPKGGGRDEINRIAMSFKGKVAYRYGGKGGDLPTGNVFYDNGKNYQCEGDRCGNFCPDNNFCLDCSGFTGHVLDCAGIQGNLGGTDAIFKNGSPITGKDLDNNIINGRELQPGDLIGGRSWHVIMYIGNGKVIESQSGSGTSGRQKGAGIVVSDLAKRIGKNPKFTHVRFVQ